MKAAVFSLASLVFALGLAGALGYGYENMNMGYSGGYDGNYGYQSGYDNYGYGQQSGYSGYGKSGYSGYGQRKGGYETTVHVPYAVPVPQAMPAYGAVGGGSDGGLFGDESSLLLLGLPLLFLLFSNSNTNSG